MADLHFSPALSILAIFFSPIYAMFIIEALIIYKDEASEKKAWQNKIEERQQELLDIAIRLKTRLNSHC